MTTTPVHLDELPALIGRRGAPRPAKFPVNAAMIGLWCDAVGDDNPAYVDADWARGSRWGGIIAPATSLNMWTLPGYRRIHPHGEPLDVVTESLNAAGFTSVAAVGNDHDYLRPLRPGDRLAQVQHLGALIGPKKTRLGEGYFFDIVSEFVTAEEETVGRATMRIFKWAPGSAGQAPASRGAASPGPSAASTSTPGREGRAGRAGHVDPAGPVRTGRQTIGWSSVAPGQILPRWEMPLTATRIIALAAATLDYNDVHFEREAAVSAGAADIYMNILGSSGLMNRYLTDWAGPEAGLRAVRVALRGQNHPGDTVAFTGRVVDARAAEEPALGLVEVAVEARNARGPHLEATVTMELPR